MKEILTPARRDLISEFYRGRVYPAILSVLIVAGHTLAIEIYTNAVIALLVSLGFVICPSVRHFIFPLCAYIYQISTKYSPGLPAYSDHYFTGARGVAVILFFVLLALCLGYRSVKSGILRRGAWKGAPLALPSALFTAALLLGGAFSGQWRLEGLLFGAACAASIFLVFYFFCLGLAGEDGEELLSYFIYVSALLAAVLIAQTLLLYLGGGVVVGGTVNKESIVYGWGIWTTAGMGLAVLIPTLILGAIRGEGMAYLFLSVAAFASIILNMSRAALLVGGFAFFAAFGVGCFFGKRKRTFRAVGLSLLACAAAAFVLFNREIYGLLSDYFDRGLSDNGRFELWRYGLREFFEAPLFGKGFYGIETDVFEAIGFLPDMLHNTPIQIAASMGIFGLACYFYYRIETLKLFLTKPSIEKSLLGMSLLTFLLGSLFDNFLFYIQPAFYYSITLAISYRIR